MACDSSFIRNLFPRSVAFLACLLFVFGGCNTRKPFLHRAEFSIPLSPAQLAEAEINSQNAEAIYSRAVELDGADDLRCLDEYLRCCRALWSSAVVDSAANPESRRVGLYRSSVGRLMESAQRLGVFDPTKGIRTATGVTHIRFHASAWNPREFRRFMSVGDYFVPKDVKPKTQMGVGAPMLAFRESDRAFVQPQGALAITALARPTENNSMVVDVINPFLIRQITESGIASPVAFDLTAPMAYYANRYDHVGLQGFLRPGKAETDDGLFMIEPYQPGKIPIVFIHGLASDPMTWAVLANELFVHQEILRHYQFLLFSYPTGAPFPMEAAKLRRQLSELRAEVDPSHKDPALENVVMIGHSMGGLMAKLQVTSSGDRLARAVFSKPIEELSMTKEMEQQFRSVFYFEPSVQVRRVIFMGTPHRGSRIASNPIGRLASGLVKEPTQLVDDFKNFAQANVGGLLDESSRIPSSVDLLVPGNRLLEAIYELPVSAGVTLHSVIGAGHGGQFGMELSDGVVPVSSARHRGTKSELLVDAGHGLHHHSDSVTEVVRILNEHVAEYSRRRTHENRLAEKDGS